MVDSKNDAQVEAKTQAIVSLSDGDDGGDDRGGRPDATARKVLALFVSKMQMEQRRSSFLIPLPEKVRYTGGRLYADRFASTLVTTRFSSSPNLQNLPGRADAFAPDDPGPGLAGAATPGVR